MDTARKVSVRALRILTYTILIKAVLDAVALACDISARLALLTNMTAIPATDAIYMISRAAMFVNIVACVMCLGAITQLSDRLVAAYRIMAVVLISECVTLLMLAVEIRLMVSGYETVAAALDSIMLTLIAAEKLLIGVAFLFLMRGFGGALKDIGDDGSGTILARLGAIYLWICIISGVLKVLMPTMRENMFLAAAAFDLVEVVIEVLMYLKTADAAFRIWRSRTMSLSGEHDKV